MENCVYVASGEIPDGYFGDIARVDFWFHLKTGKTLAQIKSGYFTYHIPQASDYREALWLLVHHPTSNAKKLITVGYCFGCGKGNCLQNGLCQDCR